MTASQGRPPGRQTSGRRPVAVNVDAEGRIFVLEATRHRIQVYNKVKDFEDAALNL